MSGRRGAGVCLGILLSGVASAQVPVARLTASEPRTLTLAEAVQLALVGNLNLMSSVDSLTSAEVSEGLARSRFGLKVTPSFARGFGPESSFEQRYGLDVSKRLPFGTTLTTSWRSDLAENELGNLASSNWGVTLTQPMLRGFGPRATQFDLVNAQRGRQASSRNLELARQRLAVDVVANYYNIVRQQGLVEVADKSRRRSEELLRASEARLKVGLASRLDVLRAELQLSQAEEALINRREALEQAMDNFKFSLGLGPEEEVRLKIVEPDYQPVSLDLEELSRKALANRIELAEERDRVSDARRQVAVSRQNVLPQLDLNLRYSESGIGASLRNSLDFRVKAFDVFFSTSYALDHSSESAALAQSQIQLESRQRGVRLAEHNIQNEVRTAVRNVERIGKSILLQERNIDFAEKQHRLANLRYQRGLASNFDIIDAENNLIQARSNYVSLLADHHVALIQLKRVTGVLDLEQEFVPGREQPPARHHP
jgi:outer membrane protein